MTDETRSAEEIVRALEEIAVGCSDCPGGDHTVCGADCIDRYNLMAHDLIKAQAAEIAELRRRVDTKETLLRLQETTMSMLSSDKDTLIHKLHKLQAQLSASQQETRAAVECVEEVEYSLANSRFSAAWAEIRKWRKAREAAQAGEGERK